VASGASNPEGVPASVTVSVLLGNGNGSFQSPMTFSTGAPAVFPLSLSMAVTDLNGDGKLDIVMPSSILLGKGDGTFQAFPPPSNELVSVAVGDFDGDGNIDLAGPIGSFYPSFSAFFNRPVVALYPTNVAFPAQNSPTITQKLTVSNPGLVSLKISSVVAEGNFAQTNDCGSVLPAGAACSITVTFAPTTTGTSKGAIIIADDAPGSPHLISLTGTVSPVVTLSSTSLNFGHHLVGGPSQPQTVTLTNTGNMPLFITSLVTSGDFAQANTCGDSVPVGASCTISVTFTPTTLGTRAGTITIKDNAAESPQVVPLTGIGTEISLSVTSLTFPAQNVGMSVARPVVLTNHGSTPVSVTTVEVTGDFRATKLCTSVQPHGRCATNVLFKPTQTGLRTGESTITASDPGSPQTVTLTGTGR